MSAPCSAQLRPAPPSAVRRADPTRPLCGQEAPGGEPGFPNLQGKAGDYLPSILHLVVNPERIPHRHTPGNPAVDPEPPDYLLREPPADHNEAHHGAEEEIKEIVAGVERSKPHREGPKAEDQASPGELNSSPGVEAFPQGECLPRQNTPLFLYL